MSERTTRRLAIALSVTGVALTVYLLVERAGSGSLICATGGCETVQSSRYAEIFGVPVAALGLGAYVAFVAVFAARGAFAQAAGVTLGLASVLFSGYLLIVQVAVIGTVCDLCIASDVLVTALAGLALLRARAAAREPTTARAA